MTSVTISMPESLKQFLDQEVETKGYGNVSEYIRGLLREAQAKSADAKLQALLLEGLSSGPATEVSEEFWKELKVDAREILSKHRQARGKQLSK